MERYQHYNLENGKVYNVDNEVIKSFSSDKQAKVWIDKEWNLSQKNVEANGLNASYCGMGSWNISSDGSTVGEIVIKTTRERKEDVSGMKEFRVLVTSEVEVTVRPTWNSKLKLDETFAFRRGQIATAKEVMKLFGVLLDGVRRQLEQELRDLDIAEYRIMGCFDGDRSKYVANLWILRSENAN